MAYLPIERLDPLVTSAATAASGRGSASWPVGIGPTMSMSMCAGFRFVAR